MTMMLFIFQLYCMTMSPIRFKEKSPKEMFLEFLIIFQSRLMGLTIAK
jgi:hypothetical protein